MNIFINDDGDIELDILTNNLHMVSGQDEILQIILRNLETFRGEWFLQTEMGVPWFQDILVKNPRVETIDAAIIEVIAGSKGVISIQSYQSTFDKELRSLFINFSVQVVTGIIDFSKELKLG